MHMGKQCIIYETLNSVRDVQISKADGLMTLSGVFGVCGIRNRNKRVYETANYSAVLNEMKDRIKKDGGIPGELEHPQTMNITLENISHKITDVNIDENGVVSGTIVLLNTPKGKIAQSIIEGGLPLFISSRASGTVDPKSGKVTLEKLSTYDLVGTPGFEQARLHLNENQVCESLDGDQIYYITESDENNEHNNMNENQENQEIQELRDLVEKLQERINTLENNVNESISDQIDNKIDDFVQTLEEQLDENQKRLIKTMAQGIETWINEEYTPHIQDQIQESIHETAVEKLAPGFEKWVIEEFAPVIEKWSTESFAPSIQDWIVQEFAPHAEKWVRENLMNEVNTRIEESLNDGQNKKLEVVNNILGILESYQETQPRYSKSVSINESCDQNQPLYIQNMPDHIRPLYNQASEEVKENIARRAKIYNFTNENAVQRFWESIDFDNITPVNHVYEGLNQIMDQRERSIREALRRHRM